jgi:hypothetical protein
MWYGSEAIKGTSVWDIPFLGETTRRMVCLMDQTRVEFSRVW